MIVLRRLWNRIIICFRREAIKKNVLYSGEKERGKESTRRVWNLFAELEAQQEGFQKLSFC